MYRNRLTGRNMARQKNSGDKSEENTFGFGYSAGSGWLQAG